MFKKRALVFLDTETTGNDVEKDWLCQVAYKKNQKIKVKNFKPQISISVKAMSVTHITNKMVEKEEVFRGSKFSEELQKVLNESIMVAHNVKFDKAILEKEEIEIKKSICTLRLARYLDDKNEIPEYNLQFLRYYYNIEADVNPHSAEGDVVVLEKIFEHLFNLAQEKAPKATEEDIIKRMVDISSKPVLIKKFSFGKYNGELLEDVIKKNRGYLEWLQKTKEQEGGDEDWIYTLKNILK